MPVNPPLHVSLVAVPEVMLSTLSSIYDALKSFDSLGLKPEVEGSVAPFTVEIAASNSRMPTASGFPLTGLRPLDEIHETDVVIIPSMMLEGGKWIPGRYPAVVRWLSAMHASGSMLCSACSGVLLLAETGLLRGREATIHWAYEDTFRRNFPHVDLRVDRVLVISGDRQEFVMSGASASWHDLVLYLIARHVGPGAANAIAKFMLLQWHVDGQAPYSVFQPPIDHGDGIILGVQQWLSERLDVDSPVEEMVRKSGLAARSFKRRFTKATGYTPIKYVQHLRIEEAKRLLETTEAPIDQISWDIGYEDPAFFRRLFKRITRMNPGAYRRKFRLPDFARPD